VLVPGGYYFDRGEQHYHASAELYDVGLRFFGAWPPQISSASLDAGGRLGADRHGFRESPVPLAAMDRRTRRQTILSRAMATAR
jgi:hypothetical protein